MANISVVSAKKKALLAHKEKLLEDIKYYETRIEDFCAKSSSNSHFDDDVSSESEDELPVTADPGPTLPQLKLEQSSLRTRLQATQELTNLQVLQSEVNVTVTDPVLVGEPPVQEPGTWREVTAECRVDLVPFSITFYTHQPNRQFGPTWYRGVRVRPVKAPQEAELAASVLPALVRPSDAVEVIKNYAEAYRSRRTSLARLAEQYAATLFMEPLAEGGYIMKCGNLLEVSWRLENKWSQVAPFHHRMKFDLEYMEENYITKISQSHKQLSDPTLTTDERTTLLSKIISICLEAKVHNEHSESVDSDVDTVKKVDKRRTTLDQEVDVPSVNNKNQEVMAPPKYLPKKFKSKTDDKRGSKRSINENAGSSGKKAKNSHVSSDRKALADGENVASDNNSWRNKENVARSESNLIQPHADVSDKNGKDTVSRGKNAKNNDPVEGVVADKEIDPQVKNKMANKKSVNSKKSPEDKLTQINDIKKISPENNRGNDVNGKNKAKSKGVANIKTVSNNIDGNTVRNSVASKETEAKNKIDKAAKIMNTVKSGGGTKSTPTITESVNNIEKSVATAKNSQETEKNEKTKDKNTVTAKNLKTKQIKSSENVNTVEKVVEKRKNVAIYKHKDHLADVSHKNTGGSSAKKVDNVKHGTVANSKHIVNKETDKVTNVKSIASAKNKITQNNEETHENAAKNINSNQKSLKKSSVLPLKSHNKPKVGTSKITKVSKMNQLNPGNTEKENGVAAKQSKIPQKKLSAVSETVLTKNPLRISPRKLTSKFKSPSDSNILSKIQKPSTNIPRLMKHVVKTK